MEQFAYSRCYQLLELEYGAPLERIEAQWRDLAPIWHPDKHKVGTKAYELASKRMQDLNIARDILRLWFKQHPGQPPPPPGTQPRTNGASEARQRTERRREEGARQRAAFRARDLCRQSLAYLTDQGFLGSYVESGRFVEPPPRTRAVFRPEQLILSHYGWTEGPLYEDEAQWELAYRLIRSFTAGVAARMHQDGWQLNKCYGSFGELDGRDLFQQLTSAFLRCGFRLVDSNDVHRSAQFELTESCNVMSLPEPYGKWLQLKERRPRWKMPAELKVVARCVVLSEVTPRRTFLNLELSTLAAPLLQVLARELADLLQEPAGRLGEYRLEEHTTRLRQSLIERLTLPPWHYTPPRSTRWTH